MLCLVLSFSCHLYIACRLVSKLQDAAGFHLATEQVKKFKGTTAGATASPLQNRRTRRKSGIFATNVSNVIIGYMCVAYVEAIGILTIMWENYCLWINMVCMILLILHLIELSRPLRSLLFCLILYRSNSIRWPSLKESPLDRDVTFPRRW